MIRVDDNYVIDVDQYNYTAMVDKHKVNEKTGKDVYVTIGHYGDLAGAINGIVKYKTANRIRKNNISLQEAIKIVKDTYKEFEDLILNETNSKMVDK